MDPIQFKAGVTVDNLFKDYTTEQKAKIEEAAKDGFTEDELQTLKDNDIDIDLIKENSEALKAAKEAEPATADDVKAKVEELKAKYSAAEGTGDKYSMSNPQLVKFQEFMKDGMISELADAGFSKNQIVDVINGLFPSIGIKNTGEGDQYTRPYGHDKEAKALYSEFVSQLVGASASAAGKNSAEVIALREKINDIGSQIVNNNAKLRSLELNITILQDEVENEINEAIEKSEEIVEDQKEASQQAVSTCLKAYVNSDGKMSQDEFQFNLKGQLDEIAGSADSKLSTVVLKMVSAEHKMAILDRNLADMKTLMDSNADLTGQMAEAKGQLDDALASAADAASNTDASDEDCKCIDPIGFTQGNVKYDFFVDKDNNADITNSKEFLGAENGFAEVSALDTDGDGIVTADELAAGNVKVVQTNADGSQEIKSAADVLGDGSIDLNSYQSTYANIGNGNTLQGTFNVNKDGETLDGYQTLDDINWLNDNYEFTDEAEGIGEYAQDANFNAVADDYDAKYNTFTARQENLRDKLDNTYDRVGLNKDEIKEAIPIALERQANKKAEKITDNFKAAEAAKAAKKADEEAEVEAAKAELKAALKIDAAAAKEAEAEEAKEAEAEEAEIVEEVEEEEKA